MQEIKKSVINIFKRKTVPAGKEYIKTLEKVNYTLTHENEKIRPYDNSNLPGGLINLVRNIPTIIVPDIHARLDLILNILFYEGIEDTPVIDLLAKNKLQIVCVGDGFHGEIRAAERWRLAFEEFKSSYKSHKYMDMEMKESLGVMEMIMELKINFPENFHFLKGNHENISNERGEGNFPFRKFAYEGPMVLEYVNVFYGKEFLDIYYNFEKNLPLLAVGKNFIISHAEPKTFYEKEEIINARKNHELIKNLTWTDNNEAEETAVLKMINHYINENITSQSYYFGGHRPVPLLYNTRSSGRYVQIHNPNKFIIALIKTNKEINLNKDIIELKDRTSEILKKNKF